MKTIYQAISIVLVALFASCNSDEDQRPGNAGGMTPVRFQAAVDTDDKTRANIDVDGDRFTGTWEEGDAMGVLYSVPGSSAFSEPGRFVYNDNAFAFEASSPPRPASGSTWPSTPMQRSAETRPAFPSETCGARKAVSSTVHRTPSWPKCSDSAMPSKVKPTKANR